MVDEKRKGDMPIPGNIRDLLNEDQLHGLRRIEGFGWNVKFVRRPLFQEPVVVVVNAEGNALGILEEDGRMNLEHDIVLRDK